MSGPRFLAFFLAACALLTSALVAIPLDSAEVLDPASTASISDGNAFRLTGTAVKPTPGGPEWDAATPRLWLGSPLGRGPRSGRARVPRAGGGDIGGETPPLPTRRP